MVEFTQEDVQIAEVYPLVSSTQVDVLIDWAVATLGLVESWRAETDGVVEHAELHWLNGRISFNQQQGADKKSTGVALRLGTKETVDEMYRIAKLHNAQFARELGESFVAYGFTTLDPDGNEWWVHVETGALDTLRAGDKQ